jgi:hypothetical protein
MMGRTFNGVINTDIRDSVPDWSPFEPPKAPEGAPSVIYVVLDDVGFSAMGCYGGPIETTAKASSVERPFISPASPFGWRFCSP